MNRPWLTKRTWSTPLSWVNRHRGLSLLTVLGSLLVLVVSHTQRLGYPNPNPIADPGVSGLPQVVLKQNDVHQFVVGGRMNGERVEFLVDTGAAEVCMPYAVARRLNLPLSPGVISKTGNGNVQSWSAQLDSVDVGGLVASQVKATVLPNMQGEQVLLGMSYLRHMELVLAGGEMTLRPFVKPRPE
ncbi:retropepsin-like aspartic protease family protein [Thiocystis violascens]|uniref:Clan AA aspartic protease, TIGR02281 family n=1 Tax=Thiocystis violascens (strain ATCC 17096 / DSM 198 / 6111) TaxID=765911 RepID=I3YBM4_THIV6|nr:retropepsin-like aspartic protease [Thiocystis violascens]AFL74392.1 clan AA aspartic protease, TIGR02281 family [Thiocystis violascens DSM 198]